MPSGYTSAVHDGKITEASEFIAQCARAFDAYIMVRDEPLSADVPEKFEPSDYHLKALERSKNELDKLYKMTVEEAQQEAIDNYERQIKNNKEQIEAKNKTRQSYENIIKKVEQWSPPSEGHVGLKDFCIQQLQDSINWDCSTEYYEQNVKLYSGEEWLKTMIEHELDNIKYHTEEYHKEVQRTNERNLWIKQLKDSLVGLE